MANPKYKKRSNPSTAWFLAAARVAGTQVCYADASTYAMVSTRMCPAAHLRPAEHGLVHGGTLECSCMPWEELGLDAAIRQSVRVAGMWLWAYSSYA